MKVRRHDDDTMMIPAARDRRRTMQGFLTMGGTVTQEQKPEQDESVGNHRRVSRKTCTITSWNHRKVEGELEDRTEFGTMQKHADRRNKPCTSHLER